MTKVNRLPREDLEMHHVGLILSQLVWKSLWEAGGALKDSKGSPWNFILNVLLCFHLHF